MHAVDLGAIPTEIERLLRSDGRGHPTTETDDAGRVYLITPDVARRLLGFNIAVNRRPRANQIARYAEDMARGRWHYTGDPIRFSRSGELVDGQHRLQAVIQAGVTVPFLCIFGIETQAVDVIDTGIPRSLADSLKMHEEPFPGPLAQMLRYAVAWREGRLEAVLNRQCPAPTRSACLAANMADPTMKKHLAAPALRSPIVRAGLGQGIGAFLLWLFSTIDSEHAVKFFGDLADGTGLGEADPVLALRRRLESSLASRQPLGLPEKIALAMTTWNVRAAGGSAKRVSVRRRLPVDENGSPKIGAKRSLISLPTLVAPRPDCGRPDLQ